MSGAARELSEPVATARVVAVSTTAGGAAIAARLPYERFHGSAADTVTKLWDEVDGLVLMLATGAAVRIVAPLLQGKDQDPAVVCVDEAGRWAVALCGGHAAGANALAREVAALLGAEPVVTTATDAAGLPALDLLPGYVAEGDVAGVTAALLQGRHPLVDVETPGWPAPASLPPGPGPERVVVTDAALPWQRAVAVLHPPSLVAGLGCSTGASNEEAATLLEETLRGAQLARASVAAVATVDRRLDHPALTGIGLPLRGFSAHDLTDEEVPNPSPRVAGAVGTPSVAEAAALRAAGDGAQLVVDKTVSANVTVAIARRARPPGRLCVVGLGPGEASQRTAAAAAAVRAAEVVIGYRAYVRQASDLLCTSQVIRESTIGDEVDRAGAALREAEAGRRVALVCSGDAGVYAMASIVHEIAPAVAPYVDIEVLPGVTAAQAAASLLGSPLGHDHAVVSLSDLRTPWEVIERRLRAAAEADLVVALYNPRSRGRAWQLSAATEIFRHHRPHDTPVGIVTDAYRPAQQVSHTTLGELDPEAVGMTTCVIVGSASTRVSGGRMVTPRGYLPCP